MRRLWLSIRVALAGLVFGWRKRWLIAEWLGIRLVKGEDPPDPAEALEVLWGVGVSSARICTEHFDEDSSFAKRARSALLAHAILWRPPRAPDPEA